MTTIPGFALPTDSRASSSQSSRANGVRLQSGDPTASAAAIFADRFGWRPHPRAPRISTASRHPAPRPTRTEKRFRSFTGRSPRWAS